jgi:hypothetical protein
MPVTFWTKQEVDDAGTLSVRLQKFIVAVLIISVISWIFRLIFGSYGGWVWTFWFVWLGWIVLVLGFYAAYTRNRSLLLLFAVLLLIWIAFDIIGVIFEIVAWSLVLGCSGSDSCCQVNPAMCYLSSSDRAWLLAVFGLGIIANCIWIAIEIYIYRMAVRLRRLLKGAVPLHHGHGPVATGVPVDGAYYVYYPSGTVPPSGYQPYQSPVPPGTSYSSAPTGYTPSSMYTAAPGTSYTAPPGTSYTAPPGTSYTAPPGTSYTAASKEVSSSSPTQYPAPSAPVEETTQRTPVEETTPRKHETATTTAPPESTQ